MFEKILKLEHLQEAMKKNLNIAHVEAKLKKGAFDNERKKIGVYHVNGNGYMKGRGMNGHANGDVWLYNNNDLRIILKKMDDGFELTTLKITRIMIYLLDTHNKARLISIFNFGSLTNQSLNFGLL